MFENNKIKSEIHNEIISDGKKNAITFGIVGVISSAIIVGVLAIIKFKKNKVKFVKPEIILPKEQEVPQVTEDQVKEAEETAAKLRREFKQIYAIPNSKETIMDFGFGCLAIMKIGETGEKERYQGIRVNGSLGFIDVINGKEFPDISLDEYENIH